MGSGLVFEIVWLVIPQVCFLHEYLLPVSECIYMKEDEETQGQEQIEEACFAAVVYSIPPIEPRSYIWLKTTNP